MNKVILQILVAVVQWALVVIGAPLLIGLVRKAKARLQGRRGAGMLQPYRDLRKLMSKEVVISENTSWVFTLAPYVSFGTMLLAALIVPIATTACGTGFIGNIILLMYVFLLGTFFLSLAALDAGSSFGGMGSSREMAIAALAEPTVMVAIFAIALRAGSTGLKRDPYARELGSGFPHCDCVVRDPQGYPWHDQDFQPPAFHDLIIYQFHIGTFAQP